jgi:serine/threonine-protein kinase
MPEQPNERPRPNDPPKSQRSVLAVLGERSGLQSKVLLPDSDSGHGHSPVVDPGAAATKLVPQGRGNYQLLGEIARGGMGVILKGHDTDLGRDVAVKVLDGELAKRPAVVQRFVEEAQIGGQLQHPGIVPVYELGLMADERPYFTMKLVKGRTLAALLAERNSPADDRGRLLATFESVCQTMAYAHSKSVLHRDLKPANIMVGAFGEVQVVDWGLAKVMQRGGVADEKRSKNATLNTVIETVRSGPKSAGSGSNSMVGSVMGTPAYMAPEQAQGEVDALDERADVFSLGAILCELLTGRPPYVESAEKDAESVLSQAAFAKLEPAKKALEACGADPALIHLCHQCLMPAKGVRPASAAVVAKAVHEYLTSTEERARKAEIDATEARIKAAEERRARRLTLALAGTIVAALGLTGGGLWWAARERARTAEERAKRAELVRADVEAAQGESIELRQAGKHDEALAAARRAVARAQSGDVDAALLARAQHFVEGAERDAAAAATERKLAEQDEALLSRLVDLRLAQAGTLGFLTEERKGLRAKLDADFTKAFRDYGVDLEGDDLVPALKRIRERKISLDVAIALDDWGRLRRKVQGAKSEKAENLYVLSLDLDPDPARVEMRDAIAAFDRSKLLALASAENLPKLGPGSIFVLCSALWENAEGAQRGEVFRVLEQALRLYPGDFGLQALAGALYQDDQRFESAFACRKAAAALRPNDVRARARVAESAFFLGRLTDAEAYARDVLAADPRNVDATDILGLVQMMLGDLDGALATLTRYPDILSEPTSAFDVRIAQYLCGKLSREEVHDLVESEPFFVGIAGYLYALVDHPDPKQRDPEYVLKFLEDRGGSFSRDRWPATLQIVARVRLEDWAGALAVFEKEFKPQQLMLLTPMSYEFLRALIYAKLGRQIEARQAYDRGMLAWEEATRDHPDAWAKSDAMRWRRDAEAALGK